MTTIFILTVQIDIQFVTQINSGGNHLGGEYRCPVSIIILDGHIKTKLSSHSLHLSQILTEIYSLLVYTGVLDQFIKF